MKVSLQNAGKRFNRDWIFRSCSLEFLPQHSYAITGPNGSGKSTLLQVVAGATMHSEGKIIYTHNDQPITEPYRYIAIAAPYLELIEELTATEMLEFHAAFKPLTASVAEMLAAVQLEKAAGKQIRYFSSGMKQRLKLAQAFYSDAPLLLLDEPTTNLDNDGIELYRRLIKEQLGKKLIIISSNVSDEYDFCDEAIRIDSFK
ncbi:MAG: ABC transporter ATP-binding protein [Sphingobacteriales bacterium]|nr:MAG: ABC transporter ATP-binding protein [Sphingobacteriales bacterium]